MSAKQIDHLLKMANQIALNLNAWGDEAEVAALTREHLQKFWTPAMLDQLSRFWREGGEGLSPAVCHALDSMQPNAATEV
tara:strand:- start:59649 stop:59888 length:240 start_codon:yes stop_codon:yes gene_type:complete